MKTPTNHVLDTGYGESVELTITKSQFLQCEHELTVRKNAAVRRAADRASIACGEDDAKAVRDYYAAAWARICDLRQAEVMGLCSWCEEDPEECGLNECPQRERNWPSNYDHAAGYHN